MKMPASKKWELLRMKGVRLVLQASFASAVACCLCVSVCVLRCVPHTHCRLVCALFVRDAGSQKMEPKADVGPEQIIAKVCRNASLANVTELRRELLGAWMDWITRFMSANGINALHAAASKAKASPQCVIVLSNDAFVVASQPCWLRFIVSPRLGLCVCTHVLCTSVCMGVVTSGWHAWLWTASWPSPTSRTASRCCWSTPSLWAT